MGSIVQQVNLYRGREDANALNASAKLLLLSGIAVLLAVALLAVAGEFYLSGVSDDRDRVAQRLRQRQVELTEVQETLKRPELDPFLQAELARLQVAAQRLRSNLHALRQHRETGAGGFSEVFGGLARNTLNGLWLSRVALSAGGDEMWLRGRTNQPALIPKLLQTLAAEQAFAGRSFRKVSFERRAEEPGSPVDFELRSAQLEEANDAG